MMQFKKARLSLAMALALTGGLGATTGSMAAEISVDGLGQALIFPYYSVRDGQTSLFNVTNTSDRTVAVKVRFRESHNSRDIMDFNIVMSPRDVWTGYLADSADGPVLRSDDNTCTAPVMTSAGFLATNFAYTDLYTDGGSDSIDRSREGYVEFITMGSTSDNPAIAPGSAGHNPTAYYAKHVGDSPRDCAKVSARFAALGGALNGATADRNLLTGTEGSGLLEDNDGILENTREDMNHSIVDFNPLKGNFTLLDSTNGVAGGTTAVAITNFYTGATNLVTAQEPPYFLEPTLMSARGVWTVSEDVPIALQRMAMVNEWAANGKNGAQIDWVITMPTKNFYVDYPESSLYGSGVLKTENNWNAAMNTARQYSMNLASPSIAANAAGLSTITGFGNLFNGKSNVNIDYTVFDREEGEEAIGSVTLSPQPASSAQALKYEVNVLTFNDVSTLSSAVNSNINIPTGLSTDTGWMTADIGDVPSVGFMFKKRDFGDATKNFGQIIDHGFE